MIATVNVVHDPEFIFWLASPTKTAAIAEALKSYREYLTATLPPNDVDACVIRYGEYLARLPAPELLGRLAARFGSPARLRPDDSLYEVYEVYEYYEGLTD